jgi:RNA polymerase subunit RPABC4/transcription elongation factor Spt4
MQEILNTIGGAIGSVFDNPVIKLGFQIVAIYWVVLWLAAAYWAFRDMQLRTENPVAPYFAAASIIVLTPILFPLAVFAYRIVRPQERIGEIYERNLAEEAMLAEIETIRHCPTCERRVHADWIICPTCRTRLNLVCPNCARLVGLDWSLCAWCGRDFERADSMTTPTVTAPVRDALSPGEPAPAIRSAARAQVPRPAAARPIDSLTES